VASEDKFGRIKQLMSAGKEKGYVLYDEVNELLTEEYPGGRELEELLTELDSAGVERALFPEMVRHPAVMTNARGVAAVSIAEHAFALILAFTRALPLAFRNQQERRWAHTSLIDPSVAPELVDLWGEKFDAAYRALERSLEPLQLRRAPDERVARSGDPEALRVLRERLVMATQ